MNFGEWKAQMIEEPGFDGYRLYLYRKYHAQTEFMLKSGELYHLQQGAQAQDTDLAFAQLSYEQIQTLAETFASKGMKTINDHKNEGLLEATRSHLEDMRSLVFKKVGGKAK